MYKQLEKEKRKPGNEANLDQVKSLVENIDALDSKAFQTDLSLERELIFSTISGRKPSGVPLISLCTSCLLCGSKLQVRKDQHAPVVSFQQILS